MDVPSRRIFAATAALLAFALPAQALSPPCESMAAW